MHPTPGMIKLNMSCAASNSYLTLLPYYHDESKFDITKSDIPKMLKDMKETPTRHLIMTIFNSRKSGRHPGLGVDIYCYYCNICLNTFGIGLTLVFYIYKRSAKVSYRLARNRGKTTEAPAL